MVASRVCLISMDQNPYESPSECGASARRESGTNASGPRSSLLCIVIGLIVAYALWDAFVVWVTSH